MSHYLAVNDNISKALLKAFDSALEYISVSLLYRKPIILIKLNFGNIKYSLFLVTLRSKCIVLVFENTCEIFKRKVALFKFSHYCKCSMRKVFKENSSQKNLQYKIPKKQKQPPEVFCKKRCSYKFYKIHRKTPVPESLF